MPESINLGEIGQILIENEMKDAMHGKSGDWKERMNALKKIAKQGGRVDVGSEYDMQKRREKERLEREQVLSKQGVDVRR